MTRAIRRALRQREITRWQRRRPNDTPADHRLRARTPTPCSCPMCGHRRTWHGPTMQEQRALRTLLDS